MLLEYDIFLCKSIKNKPPNADRNTKSKMCKKEQSIANTNGSPTLGSLC